MRGVGVGVRVGVGVGGMQKSQRLPVWSCSLPLP